MVQPLGKQPSRLPTLNMESLCGWQLPRRVDQEDTHVYGNVPTEGHGSLDHTLTQGGTASAHACGADWPVWSSHQGAPWPWRRVKNRHLH